MEVERKEVELRILLYTVLCLEGMSNDCQWRLWWSGGENRSLLVAAQSV